MTAPGATAAPGGSVPPGVAPAVATFGPPVSIYTRRQAVEDGVLWDVWEHDAPAVRDVIRQHLGRSAGPGAVCLSAAATQLVARALEHPRWANDAPGIVHDLLTMARPAVARSVETGGRLTPFRWILNGCGVRANVAQTWYVGATMENNLPGAVSPSALTFMLPGED